MTPAAGVSFRELDSTDVVDDTLEVFIFLSDGSLVGAWVPLAELIERGHTVVEPTGKPALYAVPAMP